MKNAFQSASAKEQRLTHFAFEHVREGWNESMAYEPVPHAKGDLFTGGINTAGKVVHEALTVFDDAVHDVLDPNDPTPLGTGPLRRARRGVRNAFGRVFSKDLIKKPIRTIATAAYETAFEIPQLVLLDIPETLSGNTNNTRYRVSSTLTA